jgi:hypothetical protein
MLHKASELPSKLVQQWKVDSSEKMGLQCRIWFERIESNRSLNLLIYLTTAANRPRGMFS